MTWASPVGMQPKKTFNQQNDEKETDFRQELPALDVSTMAKSDVFRQKHIPTGQGLRGQSKVRRPLNKRRHDS